MAYHVGYQTPTEKIANAETPNAIGCHSELGLAGEFIAALVHNHLISRDRMQRYWIIGANSCLFAAFYEHDIGYATEFKTSKPGKPLARAGRLRWPFPAASNGADHP